MHDTGLEQKGIGLRCLVVALESSFRIMYFLYTKKKKANVFSSEFFGRFICTLPVVIESLFSLASN